MPRMERPRRLQELCTNALRQGPFLKSAHVTQVTGEPAVGTAIRGSRDRGPSTPITGPFA